MVSYFPSIFLVLDSTWLYIGTVNRLCENALLFYTETQSI